MTCFCSMSPRIVRRVLLLGFLLVALAANPLGGQEVEIENSGTHEALSRARSRGGSSFWYDPASEQLKPVPVQSRLDDSANRESRWLPKPPRSKASESPPQPTPQATPQAPSWWRQFFTSRPTLTRVLGWLFFFFCVVLVISLLVTLFRRIELRGQSDTDDEAFTRTSDAAREAIRIEQLPIEIRQARGDLLAEADQMQQSGRLDEAIIYLFGHRLLQLDRVHAIRLSRGKTNQQYLRELSTREPLRRLLGETVSFFERSYFGKHSLIPQEYLALRTSQSDFDALIRREQGVER